MAKRLLGVDGVAAHMIPGLVRRGLYLHRGTRLIDPRGVVLLCLGTSCSSNSVELCSHSSNRRHWFHQLCSCFISRNHSTTNWVSFSCFFFFCFCFFCARLCVCFVLSIRRVAVFLSFCLFVFSSSSSWITRKWVLENGFLEISSNLIFWVMGFCSSSTLNIPWEFVSKKMSKDSYLAAMLSGHNVVTGRSRRLESRHNCVCFLHKFSRTMAIISVAVTVFFHIQCTCCRFAQAKCFFLKEPNPLKDT